MNIAIYRLSEMAFARDESARQEGGEGRGVDRESEGGGGANRETDRQTDKQKRKQVDGEKQSE